MGTQLIHLPRADNKKKKSTTDHTFIFTLQNAVYTVWKINRRGMNIVCEF